ncbi:hypothetical protein [Paenibacillus sp. FSL H8-0034]|uniref:hypothetical protein n=1 Tax=Paenibacillus sp. FSL H8-0034 TaxID=2954671 RepID=UPI0030FA36D5
MIQFGSLDYAELRFQQMRATVEIRDKQWIDVELHLELEEGMALPDDFTELTALIFCTYAGEIAQIVPQDEGRDCEYQFTADEKEQLIHYYEQNVKPKLLSMVS